ncbi:hypothetical protein [Streptosporangium lutulentum]|uniref:Alkylmercury lyase n=1 Tax=Streptosporangium lutulentum TaxID=1461250 RepID=A0ABT9Q470_9ACTN|nr:hypothetical protein [Streptosporangium lutulentum]MDP9841532.1 hypothetical protein [Streptosporangium lutulentum]
MTDEAALWRQFATLLPPLQAQEVMDCWDIGEQEDGLDLLVSGLLEHQVPIRETTRAEIAVTAESWGMWTALAPSIVRCRSSDGVEASLQLVERGDNIPMPGPSVGTDTISADLLLIPWIFCTRCGQVLARAHTREPWGDLSYLARHYVVFTPNPSTMVMFEPDAAWNALTVLRTSCGQP